MTTPTSWSPYQPNYPQPIAEYAVELAKKCLGCDPHVEFIRPGCRLIRRGRAHPAAWHMSC